MYFMKLTFLVAFVLAILLAGCGSHDSSGPRYTFHSRKISIESEPSGAHVYQLAALSGQRVDLGMTPLKDRAVIVMTSAKGRSATDAEGVRLAGLMEGVHVRIEKDGYKVFEGNLPTSSTEL